MKSGKLRAADLSVLHKVAWPHEAVYNAVGQPAIYGDISIPLFISRYLAVMEDEKPAVHPLMAWHFQELMGMWNFSCHMA